MDDLLHGIRNKRGDWTPNGRLEIAPFFRLPWSAKEIVAFFVGYFLPWNLLFMAVAAVYWFFLTPSLATMTTLSGGWIVYLLLRNSVAVLLFYSALEFRLYRSRKQGTSFKYNGQFPGDRPSNVFMLKSQTIDGAIRTFTSGVPIWTAYEVLILWCYANGYGHFVSFADHPVWLTVFWLFVPIYHQLHFFCVHRLIHVPVIYKHVHSVHHNSVNPSPWSSLSMHPVEHLLYFSSSLLHLILPSHPMLALYQLNFAGLGAIVGHIGFDKILAGDQHGMDTHAYAHYLHHKHFEVNYGDGSVPLDKLFGTWHDGTKEGDALLQARFEKKQARLNA